MADPTFADGAIARAGWAPLRELWSRAARLARPLAAAALCSGALLVSRAWIANVPLRTAGWPLGAWRFVLPLAVVAGALHRCARAPEERTAFSLGAWGWWLGIALAAAASARTPPLLFSACAPYALFAAALFAARGLRVPREELRRVLALVGLGLAITVLLDAEGLLRVDWQRRPGGVLGNRNFAGEYLALVTPFVLASRGRARAAAALVLGAALLWTRCRAGWLAVALGAALALAAAPPPERRAIARATALLALGAFAAAWLPVELSWSEPSPYARTFGRLFDLASGSGELRVRVHLETLHLLRGRWLFGLAPGAWQSLLELHHPELAINRAPHSDFLRALVDGGVVSLAGLCAMLASALRAGWRARREFADGVAAIAALAVICLADSALYRPETLVCAAFVLEAATRLPRTAGASA